MQTTICQAIPDRMVILLYCDGRPRQVEPHIVGYDSDGDLTLSCWQLSGGGGVGWRDFHVSKLGGLSITEQQFSGPRPGYNPNDKTLDRIVCRL